VRLIVTAPSRQFAQVTLILVLFLLVDCASARATWTIGVDGTPKGEATADAAPPAPTGVVAVCTSSSGATVKITWTAVGHASTYTIWESTTSATSGFSAVATGVSGTSWTTGTLASGKYWFEVSARVGANWASPNSTASAKRTVTGAGCT
jgi:hypothetical protein